MLKLKSIIYVSFHCSINLKPLEKVEVKIEQGRELRHQIIHEKYAIIYLGSGQYRLSAYHRKNNHLYGI